MKEPILIIEDDQFVSRSLYEILTDAGYKVSTASSGEEGIVFLGREKVSLVILDMKLPCMDGMQVLLELKRKWQETAVIILTAYATVNEAVEAMKLGADDYLMKTCSLEELKIIVEKVLAHRQLQHDYSELKRELGERYHLHNIAGRSRQMQRIYNLIESLAKTDSNVLISGETGTGKDLVAHAIHARSARQAYAFIKVDCAALPDALLESELFGHEAGAYTGANETHIGKFEQADKGVLFLDEVGNLSLRVQAKLLNAIQDREFTRIGGRKKVKVDIRLLSATNVDLEKEVKKGNFRQDLFYRINVVRVHLPPLRERKDDIPLLVNEFLKKLSARIGKRVDGISLKALDAIVAYDWPGNVRELENIIEQVVVLTKNTQIKPADLPSRLTHSKERRKFEGFDKQVSLDLKQTVESAEKAAIINALRKAGGIKKEAAEMLHISRVTLYQKMRRYGLEC